VADTTETDTVSLEAFDRVNAEKATLQSQLDAATAAVTDLGLVDLARKHFADKGVATDQVDWMAHKALPDMRGIADDKRWEAVDTEWSRFYPTDGNGQDKPATPQVPNPDATPPSTPEFAMPNPAASGTGQPAVAKIVPSAHNPEYQALLLQGSDAVKQAEKEGRIAFRSPPPPG
jgi:hypothetical protein